MTTLSAMRIYCMRLGFNRKGAVQKLAFTRASTHARVKYRLWWGWRMSTGDHVGELRQRMKVRKAMR